MSNISGFWGFITDYYLSPTNTLVALLFPTGLSTFHNFLYLYCLVAFLLALIVSSFPLAHFPIFIEVFGRFLLILMRVSCIMLVWEYWQLYSIWVFLARIMLSFSFESRFPSPAPAKRCGFLYKYPITIPFSVLLTNKIFSPLYFLNCYCWTLESSSSYNWPILQDLVRIN